MSACVVKAKTSKSTPDKRKSKSSPIYVRRILSDIFADRASYAEMVLYDVRQVKSLSRDDRRLLFDRKGGGGLEETGD